MSKSLKRVTAAIEAAGMNVEILETGKATTATKAAAEVGCSEDQIVKSIVFAGAHSGKLYLFLTAGGQRVDLNKAAGLAGEAVQKSDAAIIRKITGFAIGGVSPLGHLTRITCFMDQTLLQFDHVWAAAGTPHHVFKATPQEILTTSKGEIADFIQ